MAMIWQSLAIGTEISVVADSTFVAIATNIAMIQLRFAQRAIAVNTVVHLARGRRVGKRFVHGNEAVSRVSMRRSLNTCRTVIPVRAVHAFMAYTVDVL